MLLRAIAFGSLPNHAPLGARSGFSLNRRVPAQHLQIVSLVSAQPDRILFSEFAYNKALSLGWVRLGLEWQLKG